ncbi:hypothetical protein TNCV_4720311 [Trichonephila clavipes]|uniref:Uncharacterized protein n=1 Tax=Trichonephila clavipes TaxID=2585209 RepID=A0A8X6W6B8_TRICX|nr:hypothetical protein TNCV_4720311 [Trichonephila clavipes]
MQYELSLGKRQNDIEVEQCHLFRQARGPACSILMIVFVSGGLEEISRQVFEIEIAPLNLVGWFGKSLGKR